MLSVTAGAPLQRPLLGVPEPAERLPDRPETFVPAQLAAAALLVHLAVCESRRRRSFGLRIGRIGGECSRTTVMASIGHCGKPDTARRSSRVAFR